MALAQHSKTPTTEPRKRVAINGYGRIGRCVLRALYENGYDQYLQIVAINELADLATIDYLTRYDSTHGRFNGDVSIQADQLVVNGDAIAISHHEDAKNITWPDIDLVLECSGSFSDRATAQIHLAAGAKKLLFSQPADTDVDATIVYGVNHQDLTPSMNIVSNASCTTQCLIPLLTLLESKFGIEQGVTTTIHSAMNDQPVIDAYHSDLRRTRSAGQSLIPVNTNLAKGIARILPQLEGRIESVHIRVPTQNVSLMDLSIQVKNSVTINDVNDLFKRASQESLRGVLDYTEEPHASVDFNHDAHSVTVDGTQTRVSGEKLIKILAWFDNEWGFANRMLDTAGLMLGTTQPSA
jgi:erythrose-4-phosphate dehydrogenase